MDMYLLEMQAYGDFDILQTRCILYHTQPFNVNALLREYCRDRGLDVEVTADTAYVGTKLREHTDEFIEFLKTQKGFKGIKTFPAIFCD